MALNAIYEGDFCGFSYGFRPGRGPHDALDALSTAIKIRKVNWILDADIQNFFGAVSQNWLVRFLEHRIGDKRIIRMIQKWLKAGILEDGVVTVDDRGTGQGSVISPLLANVYLHYCFDLWAERWRRREAQGDMIVVRYADDLAVGFEHAYAQCRSNKGAPGVDRQDFEAVEAYGVERWLGELALALRQESYRPDPIRRVFIPKANGKLRPLGISTLRDRVCMTAAMLVLEPIFEADLPSELYAYRPGRNAQQAVVEVEELLFRGHPEVVDADLADYLDAASYCPQAY